MRLLAKTFFFAFILLMIGAIVLLSLEIRYRLTDKYHVAGISYSENELWRWRSNLQTKEWNEEIGGYTVYTDSKGFRNEDKNYSKSDAIRILVIGDSYTAGLTHPKDKIYTTLLEQQLRKDGKNVEVYNMASPCWSTEQEYKCLINEGLAIAPDYILLMTCPNDIREAYCKRYAELKNGEITFNSSLFTAEEIKYWTLANYSHYYQHLQTEVYHTNYGSFMFLMSKYKFNFGIEDSAMWDRPMFLKQMFPELKDAYKLYFSLLNEMQKKCNEQHIKFAVSCTPFISEYDSTMIKDTAMQANLVSDRISTYCQANHIPFINLNSVFAANPEPALLFRKGDEHFTSKGFEVTAEALHKYYAPIITKQLLNQ